MMNLFRKKAEKKSDFEIEEDNEEENDDYINQLRVNLSRMIVYAESADPCLQREVAEKLANEAVKSNRQVQIVEYGGLRLLVPLTKSPDPEVQRLAAHALANLSVTTENQVKMAQEGAIEMLVELLESKHELIQRQSAKALANLGVNADNKRRIAESGGIPGLIRLAKFSSLPVKIEAIAAIANLAVNDDNETEIVREGGLEPIVHCAGLAADGMEEAGGKTTLSQRELDNLEELGAQCARSLRNLSVNHRNKNEIISLGAIPHLLVFVKSRNDRIAQQARRALRNLDAEPSTRK